MAFGLGKGQQMIITGLIVIVAVYVRRFCKTQKELIGREDVTMGEVILTMRTLISPFLEFMLWITLILK